jgi:rare lipoprotein A
MAKLFKLHAISLILYSCFCFSCAADNRFSHLVRADSIDNPNTYREGQTLTGMSSYYGRDFHGRPTASGEIYNMYALTAAHKALPFGTVLLVKNTRNAKTVQVKVNDRGPFVKDRILDLSYAAADKIDMIQSGIAPVEITILKLASE